MDETDIKALETRCEIQKGYYLLSEQFEAHQELFEALLNELLNRVLEHFINKKLDPHYFQRFSIYIPFQRLPRIASNVHIPRLIGELNKVYSQMEGPWNKLTVEIREATIKEGTKAAPYLLLTVFRQEENKTNK